MATKCLKDGKQCGRGNYMLKEVTVNDLFTCQNENEDNVFITFMKNNNLTTEKSISCVSPTSNLI